MAYSILHLSRNNQRTHLIVDDVTTLPVMFATIYGMNELSKKHLGTQENILCSLRFFYVYYFKKHKRTFDYDFYRSGYNISCFIRELDGFFTYLLGKQHLSDETDIISTGFLHSALSRTNKSTYGNHVRNVGRFLKYLNYRYMNLAYQICHLLKLTRLTGRTTEISLTELGSSTELKYPERTRTPIQKYHQSAKCRTNEHANPLHS